MNSGFPFTYMGDSTFKLCREKLCLSTANTNALGNLHHLLAVAFSLEDQSLVRLLHTIKDLDCRLAGCELCDGMQEFRPCKPFKNWVPEAGERGHHVPPLLCAHMKPRCHCSAPLLYDAARPRRVEA